MACYSFHTKFGKSLTALRGHAEGETVILSVGSSAYSQPKGGFGWRSVQFTQYVLPAPVGLDEFGAPLFDLAGIGQCPLDGSFQNEVTAKAADKWWDAEVRSRMYGKPGPVLVGLER